MKIILFSLITIFISIQFFACRTSFYEYINHPALEVENRDFSDIYDNRKDVSSFKTKGFYYCLDSVKVYKMLMSNKKVIRYKFIVDEYSKDHQWKAWNKILDTNLAYYFQYLWLREDGTCFVVNWNLLSNEFDEPNYYISSQGNLNKDFVIEKICSQIENYWKDNFNKSSKRTIGLGAFEELKDSINIYYFIGQLEIPDYLERIGGKVLNDTTLSLYKIWKDGYIDKEKNIWVYTSSEITRYIFKFRESKVIPSMHFMIID